MIKMNTRLRDIREKHDLSQRKVANKLKISKSYYNYFESGERIITITYLNSFCNLFHVSANYVLGLSKHNVISKSKVRINKKLIGSRLREIRKQNNWTQQELAELFNTSQSTISAYEKGQTLVITAFIYAMCKKFNVSADYLIGRSNVIDLSID